LTKSSKNDEGVFRNSPCYLLKRNMAVSKQCFRGQCLKTKADAKSFVWNFLGSE